MPESRIPRWLLVAGLLTGIVMAASGMLVQRGDALPAHAVARVNDRLILRDTWLRAVAAVSSERRTPLTASDKRQILERLIDEELLAQHGVALGLVEQDRRLRGQLVQQVMQTAIAAAAEREYGEAELRAFYGKHRDLFTAPARLRVAALRIDAQGRRSAFVPPLPDAALPPSELRTYLGPTLARAALELRPGESSEPIAQGDGRVVLELLASEPGAAPAFESVREQVRAEQRRQADERAVRDLLGRLREDNRVVLDDRLP
jgi:parvulin-like peptidyl-prolyl isomerase